MRLSHQRSSSKSVQASWTQEHAVITLLEYKKQTLLQSWGNSDQRFKVVGENQSPVRFCLWTLATNRTNHWGQVLFWSLLSPQALVGIHHLFEKIPTTPVIVHCVPDSAKVADPPTPIVEAWKWGLRGWVTHPRSSAQSFSVWIWTQAVSSTSSRGIGHECLGASPSPATSSPCSYVWFLCEKSHHM